MLIAKKRFCLDHLIVEGVNGKTDTLPIAYGLKIDVMLADKSRITVAKIYWNEHIQNCDMKMLGDRFQTYVCTYEDFQEFVYMVDEAYYYISVLNGVKPDMNSDK